MKKLLALFLACILTSQLAMPAWAEEVSEDTEQNTEASITVEEPETVIPQETQLPEETQMPEEEPTEESQEPESPVTEPPTEEETESPTEEETEPTEEPVPEETEEETPSEPVEETDALMAEDAVLLIKPTELESLTAGDSVTLTLWSTKEEKEVSAKWSLAEGDEAYGSLTEDGKLTAKAVQEKAQVTVTAEPVTGETAVQKSVTICPKETALLLKLDGETLGEALEVDLNDRETLTLTAVTDLTGEVRDVQWSSSKKTVAQVDENGVVELRRTGTTVIQATTTDGTLTGKLTLTVVYTDRSPQLTERKLALNIAKETEVSVEFLEVSGNSIEEVSLNDERFEAEFQDDRLTIQVDDEAAETLKAGNYPLKLEADCANGRTYTYGLTISVTNQLPSVSIRQMEKLNLFYRDSAAELSINVPGQVITDAELTETDDFCLEEEEGRWLICYADPDDVPASPDIKAVLNVYLEGYRLPVQKNFSIGTTTVRPTVRLSAASSTLNTYFSEDLTTKVKLLDKSGTPLDLEEMKVTCSNAEVGTDGEFVTITLEEPKSTSVTLEIQNSNWTQPIRLTHKINVSTKKPTLKLTGALDLNRVFPNRTAQMEVTLSQNNLVLGDMEFTPTSREGSSAYEEAEKLDISYDPETGSIVASIADPENAPRIGSYGFKYTATLENGEPISGGTLKVKVTSVAPSVKVSPSTVKLNRYLAGYEQATAAVSVAGNYRVVGFEGLPYGMSFDDETGILSITLSDESDSGGTYGLRPIVQDLETEEEVKLPTRVNFKVQTYYSEKIGVSLLSRGKLDTQKLESERIYTVKLTNCLGIVEDMTLEGPDGDLFDAALDDDGTVHLKLKDEQTYATNRAYRIRFRFTVFGKEVLTPIQRVTVSQTPLKVTVSKNITYRLGQEEPLKFKLTATAPVEEITMGSTTNAAFQEAFAGPFLEDDECSFYILDPDALKAGKSYSVALKVTPENNAENIPPVTVRVTVKVQK